MLDSLILFGQFFTKLNIPIPVDDATNKVKTSIQYITLFSFLLGCIEGIVLGIYILISDMVCMDSLLDY